VFGVKNEANVDEWLNESITAFLAKKDTTDQNTKHFTTDKFHATAFKLALDTVRIPLSMFSHAIVKRLALRKNNTGANQSCFFETTLELIQYVSMAMIECIPEHQKYVGDCHVCQLHCRKCRSYFGRQGTVFQVLAEGPFAILHHYGLELPDELPKIPTFTDEDELSYRYDLSLPMHTVPEDCNDFGRKITAQQKEEGGPRCEYGTKVPDEWQKEDCILQHLYLHNMAEAMRTDIYFSGDEIARMTYTISLLFSIFDVARHRYEYTHTQY